MHTSKTLLFWLSVAGLLFFSPSVSRADDEPSATDLSQEYPLEYPLAEKCCPPIRSTFAEVIQNQGEIRGKRFRYQPNGGYGLPVVDKVGGKNLLHLGADLGWYQIGEPVFCIAAGVVRLSAGPPPADAKGTEGRPARDVLPWGNVVAVEHRFAGDEYVTTIYGHLANERLVKAGEIVEAGQILGWIGKKSPTINGGYEPHLHFGVRQGRKAEIGAVLTSVLVGAQPVALTLAALHETECEIQLPANAPVPHQITFNGVTYEMQTRDDKHFLPARFLCQINRPEFTLVGYGLATTGWLDPVDFLRRHQADTNPAPLKMPARPERRVKSGR